MVQVEYLVLVSNMRMAFEVGEKEVTDTDSLTDETASPSPSRGVSREPSAENVHNIRKSPTGTVS